MRRLDLRRGLWGVCLLGLVGCGRGAGLTPTVALTPAQPTPAPSATFTPWPTLVSPPTPTPLPAATPLPTPGPMNASVSAKPKGGESCQDYPCFDDVAGWEARIQVPPGFSARYFAHVPGQPNSLTFGPDGLLYVATMLGAIYTVDPAGQVTTFYTGLNVPVGTAFQPGTTRLYVSDRAGPTEGEVSVIDTVTQSRRVILRGVPCCYAGMHAANGLAFGPDGYLYVAVGARADHGEVLNTDVQDVLHPWEASILRVSPDGRQVENYARGLRNAYDIAWDAQGRLFATNNGPDFGPPDTFYLVQPGGEHGYPWYECADCFGPPPPEVTLVPPAHEFIPHSAPVGVTVYLAEQFPGYYNNIFAVMWSAFEGAQKVVRLGPGGVDSADFATGFAAPIDVTVGPDGSLYVADWATGVIIQILYTG